MTWFIPSIDYISQFIAMIFGYMWVLSIAFWLCIAIYLIVKSVFSKENVLGKIRIKLWEYLALGLEFLIWKDILESIIDPTWDWLGKLWAIVVIRTVITFFLAREIKEIKHDLKK